MEHGDKEDSCGSPPSQQSISKFLIEAAFSYKKHSNVFIENMIFSMFEVFLVFRG